MTLLRTENLDVDVVHGQNRVCLLRNINFTIVKGRITCLLGESGSGKSTLARAISGLLPPRVVQTRGAIYYDGRIADPKTLKTLRGNGIFYSPQNAAASLNPVIKIKRQLTETSKLGNGEWMELLKLLNFTEPDIRRLWKAYPFQLSGGENQRCLLAMALAQKPRLLILDEPTSGLDPQTQEQVVALIQTLHQREKLTILLITHNLAMARRISDSIYTIAKGEMVEHGLPSDFLTHDPVD